jgi:hypothetical protein
MHCKRVFRTNIIIRNNSQFIINHRNNGVLHFILGSSFNDVLYSRFNERSEQIQDFSSNISSDTDINITSIDFYLTSSELYSAICKNWIQLNIYCNVRDLDSYLTFSINDPNCYYMRVSFDINIDIIDDKTG